MSGYLVLFFILSVGYALGIKTRPPLEAAPCANCGAELRHQQKYLKVSHAGAILILSLLGLYFFGAQSYLDNLAFRQSDAPSPLLTRKTIPIEKQWEVISKTSARWESGKIQVLQIVFRNRDTGRVTLFEFSSDSIWIPIYDSFRPGDVLYFGTYDEFYCFYTNPNFKVYLLTRNHKVEEKTPSSRFDRLKQIFVAGLGYR